MHLKKDWLKCLILQWVRLQLDSFGGKYQTTETEGCVQTLPILNAENIETVSLQVGVLMQISKQNSMIGASLAVVESVAKIVAMGGNFRNIRLSFQEYFEKLGQ